MRATLWKLHQWLGLLTCAGVLMWGLSGVMHPLMSRLQPKPATFMPPPQSITLEQAVPLSTVLALRRIAHIEQAGLATIDGEAAYRVQVSGQPVARYFTTERGQEIIDGDSRYAKQLARHYTGLTTQAVTDVRLMTTFDDDYPAVNRLLPVWRVAFDRDDGLRAYIDTSQARLATLSNDTRQTLTQIFQFAHTWSFAEGMPALQVAVMTAILFCVLFSALSGIYFYVILRPGAARRLSGRPLARWHRVISVSVSFFALTAAVSGAYHLFYGFSKRNEAPPVIQQKFEVGSLQGEGWKAVANRPLSRLGIAMLGGRPVWQAMPSNASAASGLRAQVANLAGSAHDEHAHHRNVGMGTLSGPPGKAAPMIIDMQTGESNASVEAVARHLAARYAGRPESDITDTLLITAFGDEYGFLFKRLPVYCIEFSGEAHPRYYVEPSTGALAARIDDGDALEGKSFAYLHKWSFIDINKDVRDALLALFALANVIVACIGFTLFVRRRGRKGVPPVQATLIGPEAESSS
jgi:uncharacterized iron-regulated membrane protein